MATFERNDPDGDIAAALQGIRNRLDTLASITPENILVPDGPQERYHQLGVSISNPAFCTLSILSRR